MENDEMDLTDYSDPEPVKDIDGKAIETSGRQRLDLVFLAFNEGVDVERSCKVLG